MVAGLLAAVAKPCSEGRGGGRTTPVALKRFAFIIYSHQKAFIVFFITLKYSS